jgi:hypothetical protein
MIYFAVSFNGGVAERSKAADCKSARVRVRRFESFSLHHLVYINVICRLFGKGVRAGVAQW